MKPTQRMWIPHTANVSPVTKRYTWLSSPYAEYYVPPIETCTCLIVGVVIHVYTNPVPTICCTECKHTRWAKTALRRCTDKTKLSPIFPHENHGGGESVSCLVCRVFVCVWLPTVLGCERVCLRSLHTASDVWKNPLSNSAKYTQVCFNVYTRGIRACVLLRILRWLCWQR